MRGLGTAWQLLREVLQHDGRAGIAFLLDEVAFPKAKPLVARFPAAGARAISYAGSTAFGNLTSTVNPPFSPRR